MNIADFNALPEAEAAQLLLDCCHSRTWANAMTKARPFAHVPALLKTADTLWAECDAEDVLEAFGGHPRIGDLSVLRDKYSTASAEQGQVTEADDTVIESLYQLNQSYEEKNGFIFIVCASGKSAEEMRDILLERLPNGRALELKNGAREQAKITQLRLQKLFRKS